MNNNFWSWCAVIVLLLIGWQYVERKNNEINSLRADNNKLRADYNNLVDDANGKIASANRPEATVIVNFRKRFVDNGDVAIFSNITGRTTVITAQIEGKTKSFELAFEGGTTRNLAESEGWAFLSGDTEPIHQDGHKSLTYGNR